MGESIFTYYLNNSIIHYIVNLIKAEHLDEHQAEHMVDTKPNISKPHQNNWQGRGKIGGFFEWSASYVPVAKNK